jgi:hypothetical protein
VPKLAEFGFGFGALPLFVVAVVAVVAVAVVLVVAMLLAVTGAFAEPLDDEDDFDLSFAIRRDYV